MCIFCNIINKEIKSNILMENDYAICIEDISKKAKKHFLIITKKHIKDLNELEEIKKSNEKEYINILNGIFDLIFKITKESKISASGYKVINNCGEDAFQEVKHIHFHILGGEKLRFKKIENNEE